MSLRLLLVVFSLSFCTSLSIAAPVLEMNKVRKATRVVAIHWNRYNSIRVTSMVHQISPIRIHNDGRASCNDKKEKLGASQGNIHSPNIAQESRI